MKIEYLIAIILTLSSCFSPSVNTDGLNIQRTDPSILEPSPVSRDTDPIPSTNQTETQEFPPLKLDEIYYFTPEDEHIIMDLYARLNDSTYVLSELIDGACIAIESTGDYNENGYQDALIRVVNGCGGNCCGDSFMFVTYDGKTFRRTQSVGYDWDGVEIDSTSGSFKIVVETRNEGANTDFPEHKTEICRLNGTELEVVETIVAERIEATIDIFSREMAETEKESMQVRYDLDSDGAMDLITCNFWERWGRMSVQIEFGNGLECELPEMPKRLGILETKSNGVYDLVIDIDEVVKWDGVTYKKTKK